MPKRVTVHIHTVLLVTSGSEHQRLTENRGDRFKKSVFHVVVRDGKQSTGNLLSHDQMPDLAFRMNASAAGEDRDESALFVEAKCVDNQSGCGEYVRNGLHRFVSGKYAPRVTFGMMLGYTLPAYQDVPTHLADYYKLVKSPDALICVAPLPEEVIDALEAVAFNEQLDPMASPMDWVLWLPGRPGS